MTSLAEGIVTVQIAGVQLLRRVPGVGDNAGMSRSFDELVSEAAAAPIDDWDFSWLDGRATEERPSWGYQRLTSQRLATVSAALDIDTGGGEVVAEGGAFPPTMVATQSWPPNAALATQLLHPRGVVVVTTR